MLNYINLYVLDIEFGPMAASGPQDAIHPLFGMSFYVREFIDINSRLWWGGRSAYPTLQPNQQMQSPKLYLENHSDLQTISEVYSQISAFDLAPWAISLFITSVRKSSFQMQILAFWISKWVQIQEWL